MTIDRLLLQDLLDDKGSDTGSDADLLTQIMRDAPSTP